MKLNVWFISAVASLTAIVVMAQDTPANTAPESAPKAPGVKKRVVLNPPATAVIKNSDVNLRGRASFAGETIGHLQKGDTVTVLEQISLSHPKKEEPGEWAKIVIPPSVSVWVSENYIDAETKTIKVRRVNLRGGPGENYSVVGRLEKGTPIKEVKSEKGWAAIEAPTNAFAYVAAEFLDIQPAAPALAAVAPTPPPAAPASEPQPLVAATPPTAPAPEPVAPAPTPAPVQSDANKELNALHQAEGVPPSTNQTTAVPDTSATAPTEPLPPRIVTREGFVRRAYNIQSPSEYELRDIQSGKIIEYLEPKAGMNFKIFVGTRVTVTGPEGFNPRWPRTPVLDVQSVDLMP